MTEGDSMSAALNRDQGFVIAAREQIGDRDEARFGDPLGGPGGEQSRAGALELGEQRIGRTLAGDEDLRDPGEAAVPPDRVGDQRSMERDRGIPVPPGAVEL